MVLVGFTQVAHGGSQQQPNLQPYTTRNIVALLTEYFKKKGRHFLPDLKGRVFHAEELDERNNRS